MKNLKAALNKVLTDELDRGDALGNGLLVFHKGKEVYRNTFGIDSLEKGTKFTDRLIFRWCSMTKPVTAIAVNQLIERGVISLDDPVGKFIPTFNNQSIYTENGNVPAKTPMTVWHLLHMVSGLDYPHPYNPVAKMVMEYYGKLEGDDPDVLRDTISICTELGKFPLMYEPGTTWAYSTSADVLGAIVEIASGMKYSEYLKENVLGPLGMTDTDFYIPEEKWDRFASMYTREEDGSYKEWDPIFLGMKDRHFKQPFESGGAGLNGTMDDYSKIALTLLNDGTLPKEFAPNGEAVTILKPETVKRMRTASLDENQRKGMNWESLIGFNYGDLMRVLDTPEGCGYTPAFPGEFGWDGWTGNYVCMDPANDMCFVYFIQIGNGSRPPMYNRIKQTIYENIL